MIGARHYQETPSGKGRSQANLYSVVFLIVVWLAYSWPAFSGKVLFPTDFAQSRIFPERSGPIHNLLESDAFDQQYPWRLHLGERLRRGDLPLWEPYRFAGMPFAANSQTAVWYPPNWFYAVGNTLLVYTWIALLSILAALLFAYYFFRLLTLRPFAAAAGAVVFGCSGFLIAWRMHTTFISSAIWLPAALAGFEISWRGRARWGIPLAAGALALSVLGGQSQVTLFTWITVAIWVAIRAISQSWASRSGGVKDVLRSVLAVAVVAAIAYLLGAGLASLQILATEEISAHIMRSKEAFEGALASSLHRANFWAFFVPDILGNPVDHNHIGPGNYTETALYAGVPALLLAPLALARRDRIAAGFAVVFAVGFLCAFGTPFYRLIYELVPKMDQTRAIGRFLLLMDFGLAGLTAAGLDAISRKWVSRWWVTLSGLLVIAAISTRFLRPSALPRSYIGPRITQAIVVTILAITLLLIIRDSSSGLVRFGLLLLIAADLWAFGFRYHVFQPPADPYPSVREVEVLATHPGQRPRYAEVNGNWLPSNAALPFRIYSLGGYDTFILRNFVELISLAEDQFERAFVYNVVGPFQVPAMESPVMDLLGVSGVLAPRETYEGEEAFRGNVGVYRRASAFPEALLVSCWEIHSDSSGLDRLRMMSLEELETVAIVAEQEAAESLTPSTEECPRGGTAGIVEYSPERVVASAETSRPTILVLTDSWFPGWQATVDGRPTQLLRVDHALRGVYLGAGKHTIRFEYHPKWLKAGNILTVGSLGLLLAWMIGFDVLRRLRRAHM